jgi:hypothetical protein
MSLVPSLHTDPYGGNAEWGSRRGGRTLVAQARTAAACVEPSDVLRPQRRSQRRYAEAIRMNRKVPTASSGFRRKPDPSNPPHSALRVHSGLVDKLRNRDRDRRQVCGAGQLPP